MTIYDPVGENQIDDRIQLRDKDLVSLLHLVAHLVQQLNSAGLRHATYMAQILYYELSEELATRTEAKTAPQ